VREAAVAVDDRVARRLHQSGRVGAGRRGADLLAEDRPQRHLVLVDRAGDAPAGCGADERLERGIVGQGVVDGHGVGVEVEEPTGAGHGDGEVAHVAQRQAAGDVVGPGRDRHDAVAVGEAQRPAVGPVAPLLDAGHRGGREVAEQAVGQERHPERQAQDDGPRGCRRLSPPGRPQLRGRLREDLAHGRVELADAAEPGTEGDVADRHRRRLEQDPGGLGASGPRDGGGAGSELGRHQPLELPSAVGEAVGQPVDPLAIDDAVGDEPEGAGHDVGPGVPFGRAGRGVGPTALAGAEPGGLRGCGRRQEAHVLGPGRDDGATRPAVDPGGGHRGDEVTVEAAVVRLHGPHAALGVTEHASQCAVGARRGLAGMRHRGRGGGCRDRCRRARRFLVGGWCEAGAMVTARAVDGDGVHGGRVDRDGVDGHTVVGGRAARRHRVTAGALVLVLVTLVSACSGGESSEPTATTTTSDPLATAVPLTFDDTPAGRWRAGVSTACEQLMGARNAAATAHVPDGGDPSIEQLVDFDKAYRPAVVAFVEQLRATEPPAELVAAADDLAGGAEALALELQQAIDDRAAAQTQLEGGGSSPATTRLRNASETLVIPACAF
jgi:hypothetical protein